MTTGRRITGVVLIALAVALAVTSIFVPWMLQERTVQDCTVQPCERTDQDLRYGTTWLQVHDDNGTQEFLYDDVERLEGLSGDAVPGLLSIEIGFVMLLVAVGGMALGLVFALISLGTGRVMSMFASIISGIAAAVLVMALAVLLVGISTFSGETDGIGAPGEVVEDDGLTAAYGVGLSGAAFFAGLFGAILVPAPPAAYEPDDPGAFYTPTSADAPAHDPYAEAADPPADAAEDAPWPDADADPSAGAQEADPSAPDDPGTAEGWYDSWGDDETDRKEP